MLTTRRTGSVGTPGVDRPIAMPMPKPMPHSDLSGLGDHSVDEQALLFHRTKRLDMHASSPGGRG